ncbi:methionine aminopeptidase 2 [Platysternon megacephalum]|uniref:Methionine aminopeptidase 2 n=1 Tax=Platysternon megacephalum TaxID=55544 RepID=A0A4D9EI41_9SAUR|nr:methionine aminopeptidase 2 [Platysternon megacephalum]
MEAPATGHQAASLCRSPPEPGLQPGTEHRKLLHNPSVPLSHGQFRHQPFTWFLDAQVAGSSLSPARPPEATGKLGAWEDPGLPKGPQRESERQGEEPVPVELVLPKAPQSQNLPSGRRQEGERS